MLSEHAGKARIEWFLALDNAFASLAEFPDRYPIAPENARFPFEVRQLFYGRSPHVYRILFTISGNTVNVLPYYPASDLYRLVDKKTALQMNFMGWMQGVKSYESLRSRAVEMKFGATIIRVADLKDIIRSKRAPGRPRASLEALRKESDRAEREQIRLLLSLPMNKRTHFLRVRLPNAVQPSNTYIIARWTAGAMMLSWDINSRN